MYNLRPSIDECSQKGYGDGIKIQLFKSVKVSKIETGLPLSAMLETKLIISIIIVPAWSYNVKWVSFDLNVASWKRPILVIRKTKWGKQVFLSEWTYCLWVEGKVYFLKGWFLRDRSYNDGVSSLEKSFIACPSGEVLQEYLFIFYNL